MGEHSIAATSIADAISAAEIDDELGWDDIVRGRGSLENRKRRSTSPLVRMRVKRERERERKRGRGRKGERGREGGAEEEKEMLAFISRGLE